MRGGALASSAYPCPPQRAILSENRRGSAAFGAGGEEELCDECETRWVLSSLVEGLLSQVLCPLNCSPPPLAPPRTSVKLLYIGHVTQSALETYHYVDCSTNSTAAQDPLPLPSPLARGAAKAKSEP